MNDELKNSVQQASTAYLRFRGFEILETEWTCEAGAIDIIAKDEDELVFAITACSTSPAKGFPQEKLQREQLEKLAALYLSTCDAQNVAVRFDFIGLLVLPGDRALVKHHVNALCSALPGEAI